MVPARGPKMTHFRKSCAGRLNSWVEELQQRPSVGGDRYYMYVSKLTPGAAPAQRRVLARRSREIISLTLYTEWSLRGVQK